MKVSKQLTITQSFKGPITSVGMYNMLITCTLCWSSHFHCDSFVCRSTEQLSSSMSRTLRKTCLSVSAHSLDCQPLTLDLMGPEMFTATRASACSPTGPFSSPSGAFLLSSTDIPSLGHMHCLLKSEQALQIYSFPDNCQTCRKCCLIWLCFFDLSQAHLTLHAKCAISLHSETTHSCAGELKVERKYINSGWIWFDMNVIKYTNGTS